MLYFGALALSWTNALAQSSKSATSTLIDVSQANYTITALPAVISQQPCVFNCLIPIGLADPSGCDDVTNACACLSAPGDAISALQGCAETVCSTSASANVAAVTSLYNSYCQSVFGSAKISKVLASESAAAAAASASNQAASPSTAMSMGTQTSKPNDATKSNSLTIMLMIIAAGGVLLAGAF